MESPDYCITAVWACCKEGDYHGRQAFRLDVDKKYYCRDIFSRQVNLAYDNLSPQCCSNHSSLKDK